MRVILYLVQIEFEDKVRRTSVDDDINFVKLKEKICKMFDLDTNANLTITYIDEDKEVINLCDDEDLEQLLVQDLNPIRMTVEDEY